MLATAALPRRFVLAALVLCCGALIALRPGGAAAADNKARAVSTPPVRIGVLAFRPLKQTLEQWTPTATHLATAIPERRFQIVPLTLETLEASVSTQQLDFLLVNPEQYVVLASRHHVAAVATLLPDIDGRPVSRFGGVIFTRADQQAIVRLADLAGKRIASVSDKSFAGFLIQRWTLQQAGIDVGKDIGALIQTGLPQDRVVEEVLAGRADAGFVRTGVLEAMVREGKLKPGRLRVLNQQPEHLYPQALSTGLYPEWPLAVLASVPEPLTKAVTLALFRIEPTSAAAKAGGYYGFAPPGDYAAVEALLHRLRLHPDRPLDFALADVGRKYASALALAAAATLALTALAALAMYRQNRRLRAALARAENLALRDDLLTSLSEGVYGVDLHGTCTFINATALRLLGFERDEVVGHDQHRLFHHHHADGRDYPVSECPVRQTLLDGDPRRTEEVFWCKDGSALPVEMGVQPIWGAGKVTAAVVAFSDITDRKASDEQIRTLALHDALTGLPNRRLLADRMKVALAQAAREHRMMAVLFLDLDGFKPINDRYGHDAGDAVLLEVSRRLQAAVRGVDTVARFAGDEFVLVLADLQSAADVGRVADAVVRAVAAPIAVGDLAHRVTASVGVALAPEHGSLGDELLRVADAAMYVAKRAGKNCWRMAVATPSTAYPSTAARSETA